MVGKMGLLWWPVKRVNKTSFNTMPALKKLAKQIIASTQI